MPGALRDDGLVFALHPRSLGPQGVENYWIDLHELTTPADSPILYLVDLWEHAYWTDYGAKGRERFMRDLFANSNWGVVEQRYARALLKAA